MYIDALAMFMIKDPGQFQVIVTNNLFGDIVTDIGGALQGGLGMAASGNIHPGPDVAVRAGARIGAAARGQERRQSDGRDPVGGAACSRRSAGATRRSGSKRRSKPPCTPARRRSDIGGTLGTSEVGDWIAQSSASASQEAGTSGHDQ